MDIDTRAYTRSSAISPIKLDSYFACMTALFLFVAVTVLEKSAARKTSLTPAVSSAISMNVTAHGRYGAPRWLQQQ